MLDIYTVSFFGHRLVPHFREAEERVRTLVELLLEQKDYVEFLVGRHGDFDHIASACIRTAQREMGTANSSHTLVLPYATAEFTQNQDSFYDYYDEVEICERAARAHYKSAIGIRNRCMADRSDLVALYVTEERGGAYDMWNYVKRKGIRHINLAQVDPYMLLH